MSIIPESSAERRRRLHDEQPSTYLSHTDPNEDLGYGRFGKQEDARAQVVGQDGAAPSYPAAAPWVQTELPPEPPLSAYENPALEPSINPLPHQAQAPDPAADAPSAPCREEQRAAGSSSFPDGGDPLNLAGGGHQTAGVADGGSPPPSSEKEHGDG